MTGPGVDLSVPRFTGGPEGLADNRENPKRLHHQGSFLYGGRGVPGDNWNAADIEWTPGDKYIIDINNGSPMTMNFPRSYEVPLEMDVKDVPIPASGDWTPTWEALETPPGRTHTRKHDFAFIAFGTSDGGGHLTWLCPANDAPNSDGSVLITESVIAQLPDQGIIQAGRQTHYMEALANEDTGTDLRMDLFGVWLHIGTYVKE